MPPPNFALDAAVDISTLSRCRSKRGVALFRAGYLISAGHNKQVEPFECDGSLACKARCRETAVHAEQMALLLAGIDGAAGSDLVHVKTVDGRLVPSGGPSCVQCSKLVVAAGIVGVWLYHERGWQRYEANEFHRLSVQARFGQKPVSREGQPGRSLADYRPQHDDDCAIHRCAICNATMGGGHIDSLMNHNKVAKPCTCGLDQLLAQAHVPLSVPEQGAHEHDLIDAIEAMDGKMSRYGDGEWVTAYIVPAGPWHRILGLVRGGQAFRDEIMQGVRALAADLRARTWLSGMSASEINHRDGWLADRLDAIALLGSGTPSPPEHSEQKGKPCESIGSESDAGSDSGINSRSFSNTTRSPVRDADTRGPNNTLTQEPHEDLIALIEEVIRDHRNPDMVAYNECQRLECAWCSAARAVIERFRKCRVYFVGHPGVCDLPAGHAGEHHFVSIPLASPATTEALPRYKGPRDVFCPVCGAVAGAPCYSERHHPQRLELADAVNAKLDELKAGSGTPSPPEHSGESPQGRKESK